MFHRRHRRKHFFPFWIFFILFFVFMGKSGFWMWMFPFFLFWMFGPMVWGMVSGARKWEEEGEWQRPSHPIPPQWQAPSPPIPAPGRVAQAVSEPVRNLAGLPNTCAHCGGPLNPTTVEWRTNTPHCGYCGTNLK